MISVESKKEDMVMIKEILLNNNIRCVYNSRDEIYFANFYIEDMVPVKLVLKCNPEDPTDVIAMKYMADTFFDKLPHWTNYAQEFACKRFLPYFYSIAGKGSEAILDNKKLRDMLILSNITMNREGYFTMAFKPFSIGSRISILWAFGTLKDGFTQLCDQENIVPEL